MRPGPLCSALLMAEKVLVSEADAGFQVHPRSPAQREQSRTVHELARCAVRFGCVPDNVAGKANVFFYQLRQFPDAHIAAKARVDELFLAVVLHEENTGGG